MKEVTLVPCVRLDDGSLIPLRPFVPPTAEELDRLVSGEPVFFPTDRLEANEADIVMAAIRGL